eukprot:scaffold200764_cov39-Tisochrysis_lutea.AAC.3
MQCACCHASRLAHDQRHGRTKCAVRRSQDTIPRRPPHSFAGPENNIARLVDRARARSGC